MIPLYPEFFQHRLNLLDVALLGVILSLGPIDSTSARSALTLSRVDASVSLRKLSQLNLIVDAGPGPASKDRVWKIGEAALAIIGPRLPPAGDTFKPS